jgi:hypothetical protein
LEDASKVVGVDAVHASDRMLFRILEWGGIEDKCVVSGQWRLERFLSL